TPRMTASSPGCELWLVRHGETPASAGQILAGWSDVPLTARGEAEAAALRPVFANETFDGVWSSDLARAVATARPAWGEPRQDRRLREIHFGRLEGRFWPELEQATLEALRVFERFAAPEGETFGDLRARVHEFVEGLGPGRHVLFTHGGVVRLLSREVGEDGF